MTFLAVKERTLELTLCLLIGSILAACSGEASKTTTLRIPTATHSPTLTLITKPSITPSPSATSIPSPTYLPTPSGAGLVTPVLTFQFDTPLENLEPGEYLVVLDNEASLREETAIFQFVSWDVQQYGSLFYLLSHDEGENRTGLIAGTNGRLWFEVEYPPSLLVLELLTLQTQQFTFGTLCNGVSGSRYFGPDFFVFKCRNDASEYFKNLYFVSNEMLNIVGASMCPEDLSLRWRGSDALELFSSWGINNYSYMFCVAESPEWNIECLQTPFQVGATSPGGDWVWVAPGGKGDQEPFRGMPLAILPRQCIGVEDENCQLIPVARPSEWKDQESAHFTFATWSPDGQKLVVIDEACLGGVARTWIWYYDLQSSSSYKIALFNDCYEFPFTGTFWSPDGKKFVVDGSGVFDQSLVVSLEGSPLSYPLPVKGWVVGTIQIP